MSFVDATEHVLAHFADKKPMHYRDITREVLERGFVETVSKNPEITLNAAVVNEIIRQSRQGQPQRFVQHGRGYIGLAKWEEVEAGLAVLIKSHNADIRKKIRAKLHALPPDDFESLIGQLLTAMGFVDVVVTGQSGDGGIDVRGTLVVGDVIRVPLVVQVKRWKQNEQAPTVRDARGALGNDEHGLIITTSDFSSGAREEAVALRKASIWLMNGEQLVALLVEHGVGVRRTSYDLLELGDVELQ